MKFTELQLDDRILEAISYMGFDEATPIQEQVIPLIQKKRDVIACSQTGSGKTAAYVLPILNKLATDSGSHVNTLIIVPTRELAIQIEEQIEGFSYFIDARATAIYGGGDGDDWESQKNALKNGTGVIIATPGKLLSHLRIGTANFSHLRHLILDEADRMLDMGFVEDIRSIISYLPKNLQTLMFSATMPKAIRKLAHEILDRPIEISLEVSKPVDSVDQKWYPVSEDQKYELLVQLMKDRRDYDSIIIFSSTKKKISEIVRALNKSGLNATGISSDLEQSQREEVLRAFRSKRIRMLVATDVMSRGIDIKDINLVVNFDVPRDAEDYVHRIGRTARVNKKGEAITLVSRQDSGKFKRIEQLIDTKIPRKSFGDQQAGNKQSHGQNNRPGGPRQSKKRSR